MIVNLISNAVKFCAQTDGRIELEARQDADFLRVDVKDNGIGIGKADQEKIFERFQQAGNTLTDKPQGTGLGLPISRQILQRLAGGHLGREQAGQGSDVLLPCSALSIGCAGAGSGRARSCARLIAYEQKLSRRSGWTAVLARNCAQDRTPLLFGHVDPCSACLATKVRGNSVELCALGARPIKGLAHVCTGIDG